MTRKSNKYRYETADDKELAGFIWVTASLKASVQDTSGQQQPPLLSPRSPAVVMFALPGNACAVLPFVTGP